MTYRDHWCKGNARHMHVDGAQAPCTQAFTTQRMRGTLNMESHLSVRQTVLAGLSTDHHRLTLPLAYSDQV